MVMVFTTMHLPCTDPEPDVKGTGWMTILKHGLRAHTGDDLGTTVARRAHRLALRLPRPGPTPLLGYSFRTLPHAAPIVKPSHASPGRRRVASSAPYPFRPRLRSVAPAGTIAACAARGASNRSTRAPSITAARLIGGPMRKSPSNPRAELRSGALNAWKLWHQDSTKPPL